MKLYVDIQFEYYRNIITETEAKRLLALLTPKIPNKYIDEILVGWNKTIKLKSLL